MKQLSYILKRLLHMIPVLFVVTILIFLMIRAIPGDAAQIMLGDRATPELLERMRARMGLDKPLITQYFIFLKNTVTLDLGDSIRYSRPVADLLAARIPVTAALVGVTALYVLVLAFPLGFWAGTKRGSLADNIIKTGSLFLISFPAFWIGTLLLLQFALRLKIFPVGAWGETPKEHLMALILPGFTSALATMGLIIRNLRSNIIDVKGSDYVDFARSKGLPENTVMSRHVLRNAIISTITLFALRIAYSMGSGIIIETVFALPGLGTLIVDSIFARDYAVVQSTVLILALMVLIINLLTDILYSVLDPRIKLE